MCKGLNKFFRFFYQYMALSSCAVDGQQMYSRGLVAGKASLIDPEILPIPLLTFTEGSQKMLNLAHFLHENN